MAPINNSPKKSPRKKNGRLQQPLLQIAEVSTDARMKPKSSIPVATGALAPSVTGLRDYYEKQRSPPRGLPTSTQQFTRIDQVAAMSISSGKSTRQEMPSTSGVEVASSSSSTFKNNEASEATPLLAAPKLSLPTALATSPSPSITTEGSTTSNRTNSQQSEDTPIFKNTLKNARKKQKKKAKRYLAASESSISSDNSAATIIPVSTIHSPSPSIGTLRSVYGVGVSRTRNQHEGYGGTDNEVRRESSAMGSRHTSQATLESFPALDKDESWQLKQSQRLPSNASNFTIPFPFNTFGPFRHNGASTTASEANARERAGTETEIETVVHHTREQIDTIYTRTTTLHPIHVRDLGFLPGGTRIHGDMQTDSSDDKGSVDYEQHRTWNDFWVDVIWVARNILEIIVFVVGCLALGVVIGALMKWLAWDWIEDQFCRGTCGFFGRRF